MADENIETEEERVAREAREKEARDKLIADYKTKLALYQAKRDATAAEEQSTKGSFDTAKETHTTKANSGNLTDEDDAQLMKAQEDYRAAIVARIAAEKALKAHETTNPEADDATSRGYKRTYAYFEQCEIDDRDNERNANGTLKRAGADLTPAGYDAEKIPDEVDLDSLKEAWKIVMDVNGTPFYDAEENALGALAPDLYLLLPKIQTIPIRAIHEIGQNYEGFPLGIQVVAGVYALAKQQAAEQKWSEERQRQWAALRVEAVKYGWFDGQKYVKYVDFPGNAVQVMTSDRIYLKDNLTKAKNLAGFVPLMNEYFFRCFNGTYNTKNAQDYIRRATTIATSIHNPDMIEYFDQDMVFGPAFRWIGVKRQMSLLRYKGDKPQVATAFELRCKSAPAGRALIATANAVVSAFKSCGWWKAFKDRGNYDDEPLMKATSLIISNPWKFHMLSYVYTTEAVTPEEETALELASDQAKLLAPILQAYIETVGKNDDIARAKVLSKYASSNHFVYSQTKKLFRGLGKGTVKHIEQLFKGTIFETKEEQAQRLKALAASENSRPVKRRRRLESRLRGEYDDEEDIEEP